MIALIALVRDAWLLGLLTGVLLGAGSMQVVDAYRPRPEPAPFIDRNQARRCALAPWAPAEIGDTT